MRSPDFTMASRLQPSPSRTLIDIRLNRLSTDAISARPWCAEQPNKGRAEDAPKRKQRRALAMHLRRRRADHVGQRIGSIAVRAEGTTRAQPDQPPDQPNDPPNEKVNGETDFPNPLTADDLCGTRSWSATLDCGCVATEGSGRPAFSDRSRRPVEAVDANPTSARDDRRSGCACGELLRGGTRRVLASSMVARPGHRQSSVGSGEP